MPTTWFTADFHFRHENIIKHCYRPFDTRQRMDSTLTKNYNDLVSKEDKVYILGDLTLAGPTHVDYVGRLVDSLAGHKHLILGNHDRLRPFKYLDLGFESVHTNLVISLDGISIALVHDPALTTCYRDRMVCLCGHVHSKKLLMPSLERVIHVGVDATEFKPINSEAILELIRSNNLEP